MFRAFALPSKVAYISHLTDRPRYPFICVDVNMNADVHRLKDYPEDNDRARMLRYLMTRYRTVTLTAESGGPAILQDWKYELFGT